MCIRDRYNNADNAYYFNRRCFSYFFAAFYNAVSCRGNVRKADGAYKPGGAGTVSYTHLFVDGDSIKDGTYNSKNVYLFKPDLSTQKGLIVNLEQEKNGPRGVTDSSVDPSKGYKPCLLYTSSMCVHPLLRSHRRAISERTFHQRISS